MDDLRKAPSTSDFRTVEKSAEPLFTSGQVVANRYEVRRALGRGGMGSVWQAYDLRLRVDVALKALVLHRPDSSDLLHREIRAAREVISPNVCRVYDLVEAEGLDLLSMEYIDGITLRQLIDENAPLDLRRAQEIATQFLTGLEAIHSAGLVHRDFKPANVMVTRAGRVVVMDFGLAKPVSESASVAGTPAYMSPEQIAGGPLDARTDLFAAGIVLTEMISPRDRGRDNIWAGLRRQPPWLPDSPWSNVLRRAIHADADSRFASASVLARALEEATLRLGLAEEKNPYPGLAAFSAAEAVYFFGREAEVESMWRKLSGPARLLGLIGPSGTGKSSFIHAGLLPAQPEDWRVLTMTPGPRPFASLARALAPDLSGDVEAVASLAELEQSEVAVRVMKKWRGRHPGGALLVVDQFEELFTQSAGDTQSHFATLLSRLTTEADLHVLVSLRDDFLFHCQHFDGLTAVFSELTALGPPTGPALRRTLVQPALRCGYRLEDDSLIDEILSEVEGERGALPLMAFALSQLWQMRDRERGLLTRAAYEEIGGVAGALAQHAEATMDRIGSDRVPVVRELFRNLVTSQGTRAARDRTELLSVFPEHERHQVGEVLDLLIAARLLTSYEIKD